ncbi:LuxR C-terminal-related transcriptional regulator [Brevibacillus choshinensis]|uniref:LuxR C-terminal-related transcriptional regulator n=1 Tax=Brevibacillus choshinensis TaxID=54911 RepID=UPI002E1B594F|nr:LuxR C-terminal-related transcriptional regulator [Brevibacillus choshinensis]MED4582306.1 LuxR C-terminal-related transcriptional regulator [Brevibacillus choshinensis]
MDKGAFHLGSSKVLEFIDSILVPAERFPQQVLLSLSQIFGYHRSIFWIADKHGNLFLPITLNVEDRLIQDYVSYYSQHDLLHPQNVIPQNPSRTALRINDVMPDQEYEQTIYYNQFMRAYGNYDEMGIYLKKEGTLVGSIGLARCKQEQRFTEIDVRLGETLSRTIAHTLAIHTHADELQKERMLFAAHSQLSSIGIIIVEPPAHICYVNPVAKDICAEWFLGKTYTNPVHAFIKQHVENNAFTSPSSFSVPAASALTPSQQEFAIYVQPSVSTPFSDHRTLPYAIYLIPKGTHSGLSSTREQDQLPHLTRTERRIYELVQQGYTNQLIANELHISLNTVKRHLQNTYRKLGVSNRTELCYKLKTN